MHDVLHCSAIIGGTPADGGTLESLSGKSVASLRHSFVGDLVVKVIPPSGPEFVLFDRPGYPSVPATDGYGSNLGTDNSPFDAPSLPATYKFTEIGVNFERFASVEFTQADQEITTTPLGFTSYFAETWISGSFPAGTWQVFVSDNSLGDTGLIDGAAMEFTAAVPEPEGVVVGTAVLLLGWAGLRRRIRPRSIRWP